MGSLLSIFVTLLILGLVFYVVVWLIDWIGVPEPFNKVLKAVIGIICVIYLLSLLLGFGPMGINAGTHTFPFWNR